VLNTRTSTYQSQINFFVKPLQNQESPSKKCANAYTFGFNGQEKDDEIAGAGNHTTALFWEYDPRTGRRWNLDPKPSADESPYATNKNNPIKYNDPNGDCPPGVDCGGKASLSLTFGTKGQSRINFAVGLGVSKTSGSFMSGANLSLNLYNGGPGTSQASTGQNSFGGALTLGLSGTFGSGAGRPTDVNIFNSSTISGVTNNFNNSGTLGTNFTYNNATGFNRAWGVAGKAGGFTASLNEDFSFAKKAGHGILASGFDEGETGGGFLGYTFKNGTSIFAGTEIFTGKPTSYPKTQSMQYPGFVNQTDAQQQFNVGRTFLKVENAPGIGNIRFDYSGQSQMWSQNAIHDALGFYRFRSTAANSFQITK
jgi:RHS repeat-associated protein